jgi:hypothetical protein
MRMRRLFHAIPVVAAVTAVLALVASVLPLGASPRRAAGVDLAGQPVMGPSRLSGAQIVAFMKANTRQPYRATVSPELLAELFVDEGNAENVRGDVAFAQSILETGWFSFPDGGYVRPWFNNFAGMGACGGCVVFTAASAQDGVRAQIQHLRSYADPTSRAQNLHFPLIDAGGSANSYDTFYKKGVAPTWSQMGNGNWATAPDYAEKVLGIYNRMLIFAGLPGACPPDALGLAVRSFASGCPVALRQPGRAVAANPIGGYYVLNGDGRVYAYGGAPYGGSAAFGFEIARDIAVTPDGRGYVILDGFGAVHPFGTATNLPLPNTYWPGWDIARGVAITADGKGVVVVDGWGGVHTSGSAAGLPLPSTYWPGWDIARRVALSAPDGVHSTGLWVLDGWGSVHVSGTAHAYPTTSYWKGWDIARGLAVDPQGNGWAVLDGWGVAHGTGSMRSGTFAGYAPADRWRGLAYVGGTYSAVRNDGYGIQG